MDRLVFFVLACVASAVVVASSFGATDLAYQYDLNGNLISDGGKWYEYDDANQLVKVRHGSSTGPVVAEYYYDHQGQRIKKIESGVVTYYVGKHYETQVVQGITKNTSYYFANGERVAKNDSSGNMVFYHSDHLGGTNVLTDVSGNFIARTRYYPFGEIREGGNEKYIYTGKEKDSFTNFYYYEARYYAPALTHFTQADTAEPDLYDPQSLNKYAYARNNPLRYVDPTGHTYSGLNKSTHELQQGFYYAMLDEMVTILSGKRLVIPKSAPVPSYYGEDHTFPKYRSPDPNAKYCTTYVASKYHIPWEGNAGTWINQAKKYRFATGNTPEVGAIVVTGEGDVGHVAIVEDVNNDTGQIRVSESNYDNKGSYSRERPIDIDNTNIRGYIYTEHDE